MRGEIAVTAGLLVAVSLLVAGGLVRSRVDRAAAATMPMAGQVAEGRNSSCFPAELQVPGAGEVGIREFTLQGATVCGMVREGDKVWLGSEEFVVAGVYWRSEEKWRLLAHLELKRRP